MDRDDIRDEALAAEAFEDNIVDDVMGLSPAEFFDTFGPEDYEPSPYDGTYSEM